MLIYLFFSSILAAITPYLVSIILDAPILHGFFSIDFFCVASILLLPRGKALYSTFCYAILFLYAFFYEPTLSASLTNIGQSQWSDFFIAAISLAVVVICSIVPRKKVVILASLGVFYLLLLIADCSNILFATFHITLPELWSLASCFTWGIPVFIAIPLLQTGLVLLFARKFFDNPGAISTKYPWFPFSLVVVLLLLNWGVNSVQVREHIFTNTLKDYAAKFDYEASYISMNSILEPDMEKAFPVYASKELLNVDSKYNKVVMVLVESWGVPKNIDLLKAQLRPFDSLQTTVIGLYPRMVAYTQGAEWEDIGIPGGKVNDSLILPLRYRKAGYETWYVHGYDGNFYEREKNYPSYGFDSLLFRKDFLARGLKNCQYGFPGICDKSLGAWLSDKLDNDKKQFVYWTTLDAHYPYEGRDYAAHSELCKEFNLSDVACTFYSHEEESLQTIAEIAKKHPDIKFVIRGDHRPMGTFTTADFLASFYYDWVPIVVIN